MPSAVATAQPAAALPEGKEFIRGWIVPNMGFIDYGHGFYTEADRGIVAKNSPATFGNYFETRWDQYQKLSQKANALFGNAGRNATALAGIAETAYTLNRELQGMPEEFPRVFAKDAPIKSMKTREHLLYNYWRRPVEELYTKAAAAAHSFGNDAASARGLSILLGDFETDAIHPKTGKPTANGFDSSMRSYFTAYVETVETLRELGRHSEELAQAYRAYGDLMQAVTNLVIKKYPAAKNELRETLAAQVDDQYKPGGEPIFRQTGCCFYAKWNPNPGKSYAMEQIRGMVKALEA